MTKTKIPALLKTGENRFFTKQTYPKMFFQVVIGGRLFAASVWWDYSTHTAYSCTTSTIKVRQLMQWSRWERRWIFFTALELWKQYWMAWKDVLCKILWPLMVRLQSCTNWRYIYRKYREVLGMTLNCIRGVGGCRPPLPCGIPVPGKSYRSQPWGKI